jgi:hypothetical protein
VTTATEHQALTEMYDGYGAVAREAAHIIDPLRVVLDVGVALDELPAVLRECLRRAERIHAIAAAERERWAG